MVYTYDKNETLENANRFLFVTFLVIVILLSFLYLAFQYVSVYTKLALPQLETLPPPVKITPDQQDQVLAELDTSSPTDIKEEDKVSILKVLTYKNTLKTEERTVILDTLK